MHRSGVFQQPASSPGSRARPRRQCRRRGPRHSRGSSVSPFKRTGPGHPLQLGAGDARPSRRCGVRGHEGRHRGTHARARGRARLERDHRERSGAWIRQRRTWSCAHRGRRRETSRYDSAPTPGDTRGDRRGRGIPCVRGRLLHHRGRHHRGRWSLGRQQDSACSPTCRIPRVRP